MSVFRVLAVAFGLAVPLALAAPASAAPRHHGARVSTATYKPHASHAHLRTAHRLTRLHVAQQHHRPHTIRRS